jgi:hypothetical protein
MLADLFENLVMWMLVAPAQPTIVLSATTMDAGTTSSCLACYSSTAKHRMDSCAEHLQQLCSYRAMYHAPRTVACPRLCWGTRGSQMSFGAEALSMKCCSLHRSPSTPIFGNKAKHLHITAMLSLARLRQSFCSACALHPGCNWLNLSHWEES